MRSKVKIRADHFKVIPKLHSADRTWLQKPITWKRLLQYFSKKSRWIHNFDKRLLHPFYEKRCLACNFEKMCLQVIFRHARWVPNYAEWQLTPFLGKKFYKSNILYQRSFIMYILQKRHPAGMPKNCFLLRLLQIILWYHLSEIYIGYPFLKNNARYLILKIAVSWYIQVIGFSYLCRFRLCWKHTENWKITIQCNLFPTTFASWDNGTNHWNYISIQR